MNSDISRPQSRSQNIHVGGGVLWNPAARKGMAPTHSQVGELLFSLDDGITNYSSLFPWDTFHKVHVIGGKKVILKL